MRKTHLLFLVAFLMAGCPEMESMDDGAIVDAGLVDAVIEDAPRSMDAPPPDAADGFVLVPDDVPASDEDAPAPTDAGIDALIVPPDTPADAGRDAPAPRDLDGDGILSTTDCNDLDPAIGRQLIESCTSSCGAGTRVCTDGVFTPCSASTDCACTTPGAVRTIGCGRCGSASQSCLASGVWSVPSACFGESACFAGQVDTDEVMCSLSERFCDITCMWGPWVERTPPGECTPGDTRDSITCCISGLRTETCSSTCGWTAGPCVPAPPGCLAAPRTSRTGADPICIPAGSFILGDDSDDGASPERRVYLDEFYIDRYPVTRQRFDACVAAGVCVAVTTASYLAFAANEVVYDGVIDPLDAMTFCNWDGGALITEFQFGRAARGPEPDRRLNPWGLTTGGCNYAPVGTTAGCPNHMFVDASSFPGSVSPEGVRLLGSFFSLTSTPWFAYSSLPPAVINPPPPPPHPMGRITRRGYGWGPFANTASSSLERTSVPQSGHIRCIY